MGNVLVLGFALGKISAILGKISAILVLGRLASILRRPVVDLGAVWAVLGRLVIVLGIWGAVLEPSGGHDAHLQLRKGSKVRGVPRPRLTSKVVY